MKSYSEMASVIAERLKYYDSDRLSKIKRQATTTRNALSKMRSLAEKPYRFSNDPEPEAILDDAEMKTLNDAWASASQDIYQAQQSASTEGDAQNGSDDASGTTTESDDVTDVEFEEVDDKKE